MLPAVQLTHINYAFANRQGGGVVLDDHHAGGILNARNSPVVAPHVGGDMTLRPLALLAAFAPLLSARQAPAQSADVQWLPRAELDPRSAAASGPWLPLLTLPTLTLGRYRLAKGAVDNQSAHEFDEVYHVLAGKAKLRAGGETRAVTAGDIVFVRAKARHRFFDVDEDLDVLVFFSAAKGATGGMAAAPPPTEQTPFPETSQRGNTRIFYWFGPDSAGQVAIDHGQPRWQPAFAKFLAAPAGKRWRLGENFWTTLDTNMPITLGDVAVPIGQYYCVLQVGKDGPELVLLDPSAVRQRRLDAYEASKTTGGLVVPLETVKTDATSARLELELEVDAERKDAGSLTIRFGPHTLLAELRMQPHRG